MKRLLITVSLSLGLAAVAVAAPANRTPLGKLELKSWDARKDVYFDRVEVWREGCDLGYRFTFKRTRAGAIKVRLHLALDAGPATTPTGWIASDQQGDQSGEGLITTVGCWAKKATRLTKVTTEVFGAPARRAAAGGKEFLGRVTFNRWGSSGDVYYRHIQTWREGCKVHYQFLYKRHNAARRRLKLRLVFDNGTVKTHWFRSAKAGWREIVGTYQTIGCWAKDTQTLKTSGFESERY